MCAYENKMKDQRRGGRTGGGATAPSSGGGALDSAAERLISA